MLAIDPTPPPSDTQLAKGMLGSDFEVLQVWGRRGDNYYLQERRAARGETPDWTISNVFDLALKYRVTAIIVESIAFQRTLKWLLEKEMSRQKDLLQCCPLRGPQQICPIRSVFASQAPFGHIFVKADDTPFISQFETFPSSDHDDELDCASIALSALVNPMLPVRVTIPRWMTWSRSTSYEERRNANPPVEGRIAAASQTLCDDSVANPHGEKGPDGSGDHMAQSRRANPCVPSRTGDRRPAEESAGPRGQADLHYHHAAIQLCVAYVRSHVLDECVLWPDADPSVLWSSW
jgi:hypothetical protein